MLALVCLFFSEANKVLFQCLYDIPETLILTPSRVLIPYFQILLSLKCFSMWKPSKLSFGIAVNGGSIAPWCRV